MIIHSYVDSPLGPLLLTGDGEALTGLYTDQHGRKPTELGERADDEFAEGPHPARGVLRRRARRLRPAADRTGHRRSSARCGRRCARSATAPR